MKLWDKGIAAEDIVEKFTVGNDRTLDLKLAKYDILGSLAHGKMLSETGFMTKEEFNQVETELKVLLSQVESGWFEIEENFEDVHSKVEYVLTEKLGEAGKKIHTARSRNDQVLVDLHLYFKDEIRGLKQLVKKLFDRLIVLSEANKEKIMPGYTHMQVAMPSSFGLWFAAFAESLIDDVIMLNAAFQIADQNPLGSAAGYGSSFGIDRQSTTDKLNFTTLKFNAVAAQMSRGKIEKTMAVAMASVGSTLSKLAMDTCLYMGQNFGFITFPEQLTTGSSIMPHKKNPDVWELIRARCNKLQNLPNEIALITTNLPVGYHRDYQLLKEAAFPAIESLMGCLKMAEYMLQYIEVNTDFLDAAIYDNLYTVEALNKLVQQGKSFREAYQEVGKQVREGTYKPDKELDHQHIGSLGNLYNDAIVKKMESVL